MKEILLWVVLLLLTFLLFGCISLPLQESRIDCGVVDIEAPLNQPTVLCFRNALANCHPAILKGRAFLNQPLPMDENNFSESVIYGVDTLEILGEQKSVCVYDNRIYENGKLVVVMTCRVPLNLLPMIIEEKIGLTAYCERYEFFE